MSEKQEENLMVPGLENTEEDVEELPNEKSIFSTNSHDVCRLSSRRNAVNF